MNEWMGWMVVDKVKIEQGDDLPSYGGGWDGWVGKGFVALSLSLRGLQVLYLQEMQRSLYFRGMYA